MKIIILEGCDGSGKSTLATWLAAQHGYQIKHFGIPGQDPFKEYVSALWEAHQADKPTVFDRLHLGELIYGPVMRGRSKLGSQGKLLIDRIINGVGAQVVLCLPTWDRCRRSWEVRQDREYLPDLLKLQDVYNRYLQLMFEPNILLYHDWDHMRGFAVHLANAEAPRCPNGVIGSPIAKYLIVGDRANQQVVDWPFLSLQGCTPFLNDCLREAGYQEHELAFANSRYLDGSKVNLDEIVALTKIEKIIPLGGNALNEVIDQGLHLHSVPLLPHPQYVKRFQSKRRKEYIRDLKRAR